MTTDALAARVRAAAVATGAGVEVAHALEDVPGAVARVARRGDMVITLGAGSITTAPEAILAALGGVS